MTRLNINNFFFTTEIQSEPETYEITSDIMNEFVFVNHTLFDYFNKVY